MDTPQATGHVALKHRKTGPVYYAKMRLPDGTAPQRRLGCAWDKRSSPPDGHITKATAERMLAELLEQLSIPTPGANVSFKTAAIEWLRYIEHDRKRKRSTVRGYRNTIDNVLIPKFGDRRLVDITTRDIDTWRARLVAEDHLSARSINRQLTQLHGIFKRGQRAWGLQGNPVAAAERQPEHPSGDFDVLEPNDVMLLANHAANPQDAVLFTVAAFAGLRLGELLALRWVDIDFAKATIHIRWNHVYGETTRPKSHKVRSTPLIDRAAQALDELSRRPDFTDPDDLVFCRDDGHNIDGDQMRKRYKAALTQAGLQPIRFHDLRHTFGTLAAQVYPITEVKAYMGHADIATTMKYIHHIPKHDAAAKLTALIDDATRAPDMPRAHGNGGI